MLNPLCEISWKLTDGCTITAEKLTVVLTKYNLMKYQKPNEEIGNIMEAVEKASMELPGVIITLTHCVVFRGKMVVTEAFNAMEGAVVEAPIVLKHNTPEGLKKAAKSLALARQRANEKAQRELKNQEMIRLRALAKLNTSEKKILGLCG